MTELSTESGVPEADIQATRPSGSLRVDATHVGCGMLMGAADIVPGVSGGTVALILNVYERLVTAITHFDSKLLRLVRQRRWSDAAIHVDLRFLIGLGAGIATGILSLASLMHHLLESHEDRTHAVFCGLILASTLVVSRRIGRWSSEVAGAFVVGIVGAALLVGLPVLSAPPSGPGYILFCGMVGICAMILPGISGAFLLLILGRYKFITGLLKAVLHGEITLDAIATLAVFALGCISGLLAFSRVLRWLLVRFHDQTLALLCGFMLGSLRKLWPLREWPPSDAREAVLVLTLFVVATASVLLLDLWARLRKLSRLREAEEPAAAG